MYTLQVLTAIAADFLFGDPRFLPHPVRLIGRLCTFSEKQTRSSITSPATAGTLTTAAVLLATGLTLMLALWACAAVSPLLADIVAVILLYTTVAAHDLASHSRAVYRRLIVDDLDGARQAVAMIVGRDTTRLDRQGICRAAIETVAENTVDGVTAPLFWGIGFSLLALPIGADPIALTALGAMLYKAINTMDSMFGYKNERYLEFGRTAARLDDLANFLPARLTPVFLIFAAAIQRLDWRAAARICRRDRLRHASPNSGHPEATVAGALGVRLGGPSVYFGTIIDKPWLGDERRAIDAEDILRTNRLMYLGALLFVIFLLGCRAVVMEG
ncbi:cobalamin biosynthesis protein CobD [Desulfoprunum benzoelyticum]|uniref:Cobalamin biosynthesis protein CobD n=1 Tax=Desulfoprunum benzoelyticum TaxID=1506996 RepID=A0A840UZR2_9BACT|nr:adenosylcobinamide-phosphate synthase CbiB [Desulfoprunum benzoelyticum]MBB5346461.1 adenosylcobinamide-phosphate synthase [Desulfoprunum benzoelyticum]MBM9528541.1 cobalamin biosynthesis protein CobD [Desulfoprunum benzoelyticum]